MSDRPARRPAPKELSGCPFCEIVARRAPADVVVRSDRALAFLTIGPLAPGHTLVVPARHATDLTDISHEDTLAVWALAHDVESRLRASGLAEGVNLIVCSGPSAEQSVFHLHLHVVPRRAGDGIDLTGWWQRRVRPSSPAERAQWAERLRAVRDRRR